LVRDGGGKPKRPRRTREDFGVDQAEEIPADSLVWRDGLEEWMAANKLPEFASVSIGYATPPPPPSPPPLPAASNSPPPMPTYPVSSDLLVTSSGPPSSAVGTTVPSMIAQTISQVVGESAWRALLSSGLRPDAVVACIPILRLKLIEEQNESAAANAMSLLRKVSNKISDLTGSG
jgi:hypothetical protein